jgi:tRNA threonylcarbamoyl adenosine modification protein YeaZ
VNPRRVILGIETSNPSAQADAANPGPGVVVAAMDGGRAVRVASAALDPAAATDDQLMALVERAMRDAGAAPRDLARIAVSIGPGGFTSVRIAVTAAGCIAEGSGAECVGVPTAMVVARRVHAPGARLGVALGSKGESAYVAVFDAKGAPEGVPGIRRAGDLPALRLDLLAADAFLPASMRDACHAAGVRVVAPVFDPLACVEASFALGPVDPVRLAPLYPREPEAVTKWRERRRP